MKVGETRRFALELKSDISLALAIVALRFDPKVVKVRAVTATDSSGAGPSFTQSTDATGVCLVSLSNLNGVAPMKAVTLLFIDVEGIAPGETGLLLDKDAIHLVGTDARDLSIEVISVHAIVKQ
jgi:hypothetical protein